MSTFNTAITFNKLEGTISDRQTQMIGKDLFEQCGDYRFGRISDCEVVFFVNKDKPVSFYVPDCSSVTVEAVDFHADCSCCGK